MTDTIAAVNPPVDDPLPWESTDQAPTVVSRIHMLADEPTFEFHTFAYPSFEVRERPGLSSHASFLLSVTGNAEQRAKVVASLREMADRIEAWTERPEAVPA